MSLTNRLGRICGACLLLAALGCARSYHDYPDCTPYNHCPPPPLPHAFYDGCPTPIAEQYRQFLQQVPAAEPIGDEN